jgi:hypothetical protein
MPTVFSPQSTRVVYASRNSVPSINPASPSAGAAATARINTILGSGGPIHLVLDQAVRAYNVKLSSGQTLSGMGSYAGSSSGATPTTGIWMDQVAATEVWSAVNNANWRSSYQGVPIVDQDLTVKDLYIDGRSAAGVSGSADRRYNTQGDSVMGMAFMGVGNLRIENCFVHDPCTYHYFAANINHGVYRDLFCLDPTVIATPSGNRNTDGLHLIGPVNDILIDGLYGTTGDDFLALNMIDGSMAGPSTTPQMATWANIYYGSGTRIIARNLYPIGVFNCVRMAIGRVYDNSDVACSLSKVLVDGIAGSTYRGTLRFDTIVGNGLGYSDITVANVAISPISQGVVGALGAYFNASTTYSNIKLKNWSFTDLPQSGRPVGQIQLLNGTYDRFEVSDLSIVDDAAEAATPDPPVLVSGGTIGELTVANSSWRRNANTAVPFVSVTGGTIDRINLRGVSVDHANNVLNVSGGSVADINATGISHTNASGNASIALGVTVARLRTGSDTVKLLSGTTPTSVKTDATEDS